LLISYSASVRALVIASYRVVVVLAPSSAALALGTDVHAQTNATAAAPAAGRRRDGEADLHRGNKNSSCGGGAVFFYHADDHSGCDGTLAGRRAASTARADR
jgi:hypothetical protein